MAVTIGGTTYWSDWPYASDTVFDVRAESDKAWVSATLELVPANESRVVGTGTITALRPTLPNITLPATSAGLDNQTAKWTVTLHRTGRKQIVSTVLADFPLPSSFEPAATWAEIKINKNGKQALRDTSVYTKIETNHQIDLKAGTLNNASDVIKGRTKLSIAPVSASDPIAVGTNDPRLFATSSSGYASLSAAVAAIGATPTTLYVTNALPSGASTTVPATLSLIFHRGGSLAVSVGHTITIKGFVLGDPSTQIFTGLGTVVCTDNQKITDVWAAWWGVVPVAYNGIAAVSDMKAALQAALTAVGTRCFATVRVGHGHYKFTTGQLSIPMNVTLRGPGDGPVSLTAFDSTTLDTYPGAVFHITADEGTASGPRSSGIQNPIYFILINGPGAMIGNFSLYYPNQPKTGVTPVSYPYTIGMRGQNPTLRYAHLVNPYQGIDAGYCDRPTVTDVTGQPLKIGLYMDKVRDIPRLENIHWNPWWSNIHGSTNIFRWQIDNGTGFLFGKTDWIHASKLFAFGYLVGVYFTSSLQDGTWVGGGTTGELHGCDFDDVLIGAYIGAATFSHHLTLTACHFNPVYLQEDGYVRVGNGDADIGTLAIGIKVSASFATGSTVNVIGGGIGAGAGSYSHYNVQNTTGTGTLKLVGVTLDGHDVGNTGLYAIDYRAGQLILAGNDFRKDDNDVILVGQVAAILSGNIFKNARNLNFAGHTWGGAVADYIKDDGGIIY